MRNTQGCHAPQGCHARCRPTAPRRPAAPRRLDAQVHPAAATAGMREERTLQSPVKEGPLTVHGRWSMASELPPSSKEWLPAVLGRAARQEARDTNRFRQVTRQATRPTSRPIEIQPTVRLSAARLPAARSMRTPGMGTPTATRSLRSHLWAHLSIAVSLPLSYVCRYAVSCSVGPRRIDNVSGYARWPADGDDVCGNQTDNACLAGADCKDALGTGSRNGSSQRRSPANRYDPAERQLS